MENVTEKDFGVLITGSEAPQIHLKGKFSGNISMRRKSYTVDEHLKNYLFFGVVFLSSSCKLGYKYWRLPLQNTPRVFHKFCSNG